MPIPGCRTGRSSLVSLILAAATAAPAASALAQPDPARTRPAGPNAPPDRPESTTQGPIGPGPADDEMLHSVGLMFVHKVRQELGLSDEQALRLLPLVERIEAVRHESGVRRRGIARELQRLSQDPAASERQVLELIRRLDGEEREARRLQDQARDEMLAMLTPRQKAGFVLFANRLRERIEHKVQELQQGGRRLPTGRPPGRGRGGPEGPGGRQRGGEPGRRGPMLPDPPPGDEPRLPPDGAPDLPPGVPADEP